VNPGLVIFDCDGVLVDSELLSNRSDLELLRTFGIDLELEDYMRRFVGKSAADTVRGIKAQTGVKLPDDFLERKQAHVLAAFEPALQPIEDVAVALDALPFTRCVASSSTPERIRFSLKHTGLLERFDDHAIFSATMVKHGKPAPDLFLLAATRMGHAANTCVVIEDSVAGVQAAIAAGMTALGFVGGSHHSGDHGPLLEAGASAVFEDMHLLPRVIRQLPEIPS
jgi:HAD superfamily hydrolase (TIGR01509 family)